MSSGSCTRVGDAASAIMKVAESPSICWAMSSRYRELKPISISDESYPMGSSTVAESFYVLLAAKNKFNLEMASFTARDFSAEIADTRSTASAKVLQSTTMDLSFPAGMTRS